MYDRIYTPGYYEVSTRYFWESNLYDLSGKKLLYTVQSESFDPANASTQGHEYGKLIVSDMIHMTANIQRQTGCYEEVKNFDAKKPNKIH